MPISEKTLVRIIDEMEVARLSLVTTDKEPDAMPIVFARVENKIFSPIDEKPKKSSKLSRLDSIRTTPKALVVLDHYSARWEDLWWVRLSCVARIVHKDDVNWDRGVTNLLEKYPQYQTVGLFKGENPIMLEFEWITVRTWAYSGNKGFDAWLEARRLVCSD